MSNMLKRLIEQRATTWEQAQAHLDTIEKEGRELKGEPAETFDRMNDELSELDKRIAELESLEQRNAKADEIRERVERQAPREQGGEMRETDDDVLRRMASGEIKSFEFRELDTQTPTKGKELVGRTVYSQLLEHLETHSAIRQTRATVITTDKGDALVFPKLVGRPQATIIGEKQPIPKSDPTFGEAELGAYKYGFMTEVSTELEQDANVSMSQLLARLGGEAIANGTGEHYLAGSGNGQPRGLLTAATTGVTGAITADNLLALFFSVAAPYRRNGEWIMSDAGMRTARSIKDNNGAFIWAPGLVAGEQSTLLGKPVHVDPSVPDPAAGARGVAFGDLSRYYIRDVRGVRIERSTEFNFDHDMVTYRFLFRTDGDLLDESGAVKALVGA